jgi:hypothetical protein
LGGQKNEGAVGDQGIDAMLFEDAKITVLRLPPTRRSSERNKNPAPPRLQVPSAFASDLSVVMQQGGETLQGAMEGSKLPIHQLFDHITEAVSRHFSLLQMLTSFSYPSLLFSSTSQFVFYF